MIVALPAYSVTCRIPGPLDREVACIYGSEWAELRYCQISIDHYPDLAEKQHGH